MAKNKDDFDIDFDDFNFDDFGDGGDGGFDEQPKGKARSPVMQLAGSTISGIRDSLTDPSNQARLIRDALPGGYRQAFDVAGATVSSARSLYDMALKEAKPAIKESKKAARALMPILEGVLPKSAAEKLKGWSAEKETVQAIDPEEAEIAGAMANIFSTQMKENRQLYEESEVREQVRDIARNKQGETGNQFLQSIESGISRLVSYQDQVTVNLQRKTLELQYKQYFVTRKSLDVLQQSLELSKASYESIIKNTALPEVVKIQNSEVAEKLLKEKIFGAVTEPMSTWFRGLGKRIVTKSRGKIKEFFSDLGTNISDVAMMGEMLQEQVNQSEELGAGSAGDMARDMIGGAAGGGIANYFGKKIGGHIRKKLEDTGKGGANSLALLRFFQDMPGFINEWAGSDTQNQGFLGAITNFFKDAVGTNVRSDKVMSSSVDTLTQNAYWSLMNSKTLNEVIPGWLSRIERNTRKGTKDKELHKFNFEIGDFESTGNMKKRMAKRLYGETDIKSANENAIKVLNGIDPEPHKLSTEARKALLKFILDKAHNRQRFDVGLLSSDQHFPMEIDATLHDEIRDHVRAKFDYDDTTPLTLEGKFKNPLGPFKRESTQNQLELKNVSDDFNRLQSWFPSMMEKVLQEARIGNIALLHELNLVRRESEDSSDWNMDYEKYMEALNDPTKRPTHARGGFLRRAQGGGVNRLNMRGPKMRSKPSGRVRGKGGMFDDKIPLLASNGEYMVNADSVNKPGVLPVLRAIDRLGDIPQHVTESGTNDYANGDIGSVEAAIDSLSASSKTGVDLTNDLLTDIKNMLNVITQKEISLLGFPSLGSVSIGELKLNPNSFISKMTGLIKKGYGGVMGTGKIIGGTAGNIGKGVYGVGKSALTTLANYAKEKSASVMDIYVKGETRPKIRASELEEGKYFDKDSGNPIKCLEDIKGIVIDKDKNEIISEADFEKTLINVKGYPILQWITDKVDAGYNRVISTGNLIPKAFKGAINITREMLDGPIDIYVGDEPEPRLKYPIFKAGGYRLKETGKVIRYISDVTGPIIDENDQVVLGAEDFDKLVDVHRRPIKGLNAKVIDLVKSGFKQLGGLNKKVMSIAGNVLSSPAKLYRKLFGGKNNDNFSEFGPIQPGSETEGLIPGLYNKLTGKAKDALMPVNYSDQGPVIPKHISLLNSARNFAGQQAQSAKDVISNKLDAVNIARPTWIDDVTDRLDDIYNLLDWRLAGDKESDGEPSGDRVESKNFFKRNFKRMKNKLGNAKDAVMNKFKGLGGLKTKISGALQMGKGLLTPKFLKGKELFGDLLDKVTGKVKLSWQKLQEGEYLDKITGKVLTKWEDIKGDVVDKFNVTVATLSDFKDKLMDSHGNSLKASFLSKLKGIKDTIGGSGSKISGYFTLGKALLGSALRRLNLKEKVTDAISAVTGKAKLYWKDLKEGGYRDQLTGKIITKWKDIKGAVVDKYNTVVLTAQEYLDGLKDKDGKKLSSKIGGIIGKGVGIVKGIGSTIFQAGKGILGGAKSLIGGGIDYLKDKASSGIDYVKGLFGGKDKDGIEGDKKGGGWFKLFGNNKVVDKLEEIHSLLKDRLSKPKSVSGDSDGDGDRDNSLADIRARDQAEDAANAEKSKWQKFMDRLKGNGEGGEKKGVDVTEMLTKATKFITSSVTALTTFFASGKIGKIISWVMGGKGAIVRGAAMAAGAASTIGAGLSLAGGAIASAATIAAGAITLPGLLIGAAVAGTAYVGYKLYQNYTKEKNPLAAFRIMQYGFDPSDTDKVDMIAALEQECKSILRVSKTGASFDTGKQATDLIKHFNIDVEDQDELNNWINWFKHRFTPIYLQHAYITYLMLGKTDLTLADKSMKSKEQKEYLSKVYSIKVGHNPYDIENSPFSDDDETEYDADDVKDAYDDTLEEISKNADATDAKNSTQKEVQKSFTDKVSDTAKAIKDKLKSGYDSVVDSASNLIEKGANLYNSAVDGTSRLFESGKQTYDKAVDYTSAGIEKVANAGAAIGKGIKGALNWSKNASSNLFNYIKEAARKYGVSEEYLIAMAYIESKGDPNAKSSTDCRGIYQFTKGTGKQYGLIQNGVDMRYDEKANIDAGARFAMDNMKALQQKLGRAPEPWMLYLAHQQGIGGLATIMKAAMNGTDVPANIRRNMDVNGGKGLNPQQFLDKWKMDYAQKAAKITGNTTGLVTTAPKVSPTAPPSTAVPMVDTTKDKTSTPTTANKATTANMVTPVATGAVTTTTTSTKTDTDSKKAVDVNTQQKAAAAQAESTRSQAATETSKASINALELQKQMLQVQIDMKNGIMDIRGSLLRMEKQVNTKQPVANEQQSKAAKDTAAQPLPPRPTTADKPPVSMSR